MNPVCTLDEYFIHCLNVNWLNPDSNAEIESMSYSFDYDLSCHKQNNRKVRMLLSFWLGPNKDMETSACPYEIHAKIDGYFTFNDDLDEKQMAYLSRVNSATILYGILRGEVGNVTGSFPSGKFLLPTVMMQDVIDMIEKEKAEEHLNA
jgi:hypothetical protein